MLEYQRCSPCLEEVMEPLWDSLRIDEVWKELQRRFSLQEISEWLDVGSRRAMLHAGLIDELLWLIRKEPI